MKLNDPFSRFSIKGMQKKTILVISIGSVFFSCNRFDKWLCGSSNFQKQAEEKIIQKYQNYGYVKFIPCEFNHVRFIARSEDIDTAILSHIHRILHNEKTNEGWATMDVYTSEKYLFTHSFRGNIYRRTASDE